VTSLEQIIFLSPGLGFGGAEHSVKELCLVLLHKTTARISLITPPESQLFNDQVLRDVIELVPMPLITIRENWAKALGGYGPLAYWARKHRRAVFYGHGFQSIKYLVWISWLARAKTVCHLRESEYSFYHSLSARCLASQIDHYIAISKHVKHEFMEGAGISVDRITVIPNGVTAAEYPDKSYEKRKEIWQKYGVNPRHNLIIMVSRVDPLKGHVILARAAKKIIAMFPQTTFVFVGIENTTEDQRRITNAILKIVQDDEIQDHIKMIGWMSNPRELVRYADIAVVPSIQEGFGRTVIEAMAEGTAVVASQVGGMAEIYNAPMEGIYIPPLSPGFLSDSINALLSDPSRMSQMARNGFARARHTYDLSKISARVVASLEGVSNEDKSIFKR
jgi:glycosyltransferase involved in cell wall biosynthesis